MTPAELQAAQTNGAVLIDTRPLDVYLEAHLPGALPLELNLADLTDRAGLFLPPGLTLVVHAEPDRNVPASVGLLEDAGFQVAGHLEGGLRAWRAAGLPTETQQLIDVEGLHAAPTAYRLLDVREPYEFRHGHLDGAIPFPLDQAWTQSASADGPTPWAGDGADRPLAVFCSGQGRSAFVAAVLRARRIPALVVAGGMYQWQQHGYPVVAAPR
jgi:rhodanese-related sulfurtransferase